jgi:hypothetical protein
MADDPLDDAEHLETELDGDPTSDPDDWANDPAKAPLAEAGEGEAEGFEGSEKLLRENAEGERDDDPLRNPFNAEVEEKEGDNSPYGQADEESPED